MSCRAAGDFADLRQRLQESCGGGCRAYMVPAYIERIDAMPMLPSNKADRSKLRGRPGLGSGSARLASACEAEVARETPMRKRDRRRLVAVFGQRIASVEADFFLDLGGHSLFAAQVVSELRQKPALRHLAIGDLYAHPSRRGLAGRAGGEDAEAAARPDAEGRVAAARASVATQLRRGPSRRTCVLRSSAADLLAGATVVMLLALGRDAVDRGNDCRGRRGVGGAVGIAAAAGRGQVAAARPGSAGAVTPLVGLVLLSLVAGRARLHATAPARLLAGSPLLPLVSPRLLGARVGQAAILGRRRSTCPTSSKSAPEPASATTWTWIPSQVADGWVIRSGPAHRRAGGLRRHQRGGRGRRGGGDGARVAEQSLVANGQVVPDNETWAGSPSRESMPTRSSRNRRRGAPARCAGRLRSSGRLRARAGVAAGPADALSGPGLVPDLGRLARRLVAGAGPDAFGRALAGLDHLRRGRRRQAADAYATPPGVYPCARGSACASGSSIG